MLVFICIFAYIFSFFLIEHMEKSSRKSSSITPSASPGSVFTVEKPQTKPFIPLCFSPSKRYLYLFKKSCPSECYPCVLWHVFKIFIDFFLPSNFHGSRGQNILKPDFHSFSIEHEHLDSAVIAHSFSKNEHVLRLGRIPPNPHSLVVSWQCVCSHIHH